MAYLAPYFEYDVFVSYSHGDPRSAGDSPLKRWTSALIRELTAEVQSIDTEFDHLHVWLDEQTDPTAHLTNELREKVMSSAILMIVMSPRYLASSWCKNELDWFREQVLDRSGDQGRVFVIRALPTNETDWPDFLRDERGNALVGFRFFDPHSRMPYGWREVRDSSEEYVRQLWTLQTALTKRLRQLRERAASRARSSTAALPARDGESRRIYLHARSDQAPVRNEVHRLLSDFGITPLSSAAGTGSALSDWTRESKARFEAAKRCDALALVRADEDESFIGDLLDIGVDERERIQSARGAPLPCAVLDRSGATLPIDVSAYGIERFDLSRENWGNEFRTWLDETRTDSAKVS